jgi:type VI secretion system secreted protein VgrG
LQSDRPFRTLPQTPKPRIHGIQTAKVVAKKGEDKEEISTDEHGHIWVQFYWDREPKKSCPIRVAQSWASKQWGEQFIPRIGMEVVVEFLEGDPDRPLVTGCVYNGDNKPPYALPDHKTQSGLKSDSTKGHNGYNEFMFEDKKDNELIRMHAQKNHEVTVLHDDNWTIGNDRFTTVKEGNDYLEIEKGDLRTEVGRGSHNTHAQQQILVASNTSVKQIVIADGVTTHTLNAGTISMQAPAMVEITAPMVIIKGNLWVQGGIVAGTSPPRPV